MVPRGSFAELLKRHRLIAGFTQEELAARAGLSTRGLSYLEAARRSPHPSTARRLGEALGLDPGQRTGLLEAAGGFPVADGHSTRPAVSALLRCPVLVEREAELGSLEAVAREVAGGAGARLVVISGESGTGKSRLAQEFVSSLPAPWSARTVRITRTRAVPAPVPEGRPAALVLDDAHFMGPAGIESLSTLLDDLGSEAVLLVLTFCLGLHRPGSAERRALAALLRDARAVDVRLANLSAAGVEQMAAAMGREMAGDLHRRTGGHPFSTEELLRGGDHLPWTVVEAVTSQIEPLPAGARDLASALAVSEEPVPPAAARRLVEDLDAAWTALRDAGLAVDDAGALRLRHGLLGEALHARLGPAERAAWHGRLAAALEGEALEGEALEPDRLARHWAEAGQIGRAAEIARGVAPDLRRRGATRRAFDCFRLATAVPPASAAAAARLHEEAALTAALIGEYEAMRDWLETAERTYREAGLADRAVRMLLDPTFDYLAARRSEAIREEPVERLLVDAQAAMGRADRENARELIAGAADTARSRRDGMGLARAARMVMLSLGEFQHGEMLLDEALTFPDISVHPGRASRLFTIRAVGRFAQGYPLEAMDIVRRGIALSRRDPEAVRWTGQIALSNMITLTGQLAEGAAMLIDAVGVSPWAEAITLFMEGYRSFEKGDVDDGLEGMATGTDRVLTVLDLDPLGRAIVASTTLSQRALAEAHGRRPEAALRTVRRCQTLAPEPFNTHAGDLVCALARAGGAVDDRDALAQALSWVEELTQVASGPGVLAAAEAVRGWAATADGQAAVAAGRFTAAARLFEQASRPVLAAELWCDAAEAAGAGAASSAALERAARISEGHGLSRIRARARGLEERQHARRVPQALAELTSREREVVDLAAEGLSNREIGARLHLSEGTVRNYLSTAFGKLGIARRAELGRVVAAAQVTG